jgi:hypothetical protein
MSLKLGHFARIERCGPEVNRSLQVHYCWCEIARWLFRGRTLRAVVSARRPYDRYRRSPRLLKPFALASPIVLLQIPRLWRRGRLECGEAAGWLLASAGVWCLIASLTVGGIFTFTERRDQDAAGNRMLAVFAPQADTTAQQAALEGQAQTQIFQAG